jgi:class 3 adenylate cyclase
MATDIAAWLRGLGLERYERAFRDAEVTADVLPDLTEADLEKLGLPLGPRKKLLRAMASLGSENGPEAPPRPPGPGTRHEAERRQLTVMFIDLVGSTALSARLDPEDMREVIRAYQNMVAGEVSRLEGHVAKFMGDGVLCYFGWPRAHEDEAERAVRAGLAIVAAVAKLSGGGQALACRVGIATGLVVVGDVVGEGSAREETVVGETPNLAARLQAIAPPAAVVIATSTRRLLGTAFELEDLGQQSVKGLADTIGAWRVQGEHAVGSRFEARTTGPTPLVGREEEVALLVERWQQAHHGDGQVVLLSGEPGIGKSRITRALYERLDGVPQLRLRHQCSPYYVDTSFHPLIEHLEQAAGFQRDDPPAARLDKLEALLAEGTERKSKATPLIASIMSIPGRGATRP